MYKVLSDSEFDPKKVNISQGDIQYEKSYLMREFEGIHHSHDEQSITITISDPNWLKIHNEICKVLGKYYLELLDQKTDPFTFPLSNSQKIYGSEALRNQFNLMQENCKVKGVIKYTRFKKAAKSAIPWSNAWQPYIYECRVAEYPKTYSWGELYETLREMEENGDCVEDPLFRQILDLFPRLDRANFIETIEIIEKLSFTEQELNRINSSCLDGLMAIRKYLPISHFDLLCKGNYIESCKFMLDKGQPPNVYSSLLSEHVSICKLMLERGGKVESNFFDRYIRIVTASQRPTEKIWNETKIPIEICKFLLENNSIPNRLMGDLCIYGSEEILKLLVEKGVKLQVNLQDVLSKNNDLRAKFLIENGVYFSTNEIYMAIERDLHQTLDIIIQKIQEVEFNSGLIVTLNTMLQVACKAGNFRLVKQLIEEKNVPMDMITFSAACLAKNGLEIVKLFLDKGYIVTAGPYEPRDEVVQYIFEQKEIIFSDNFIEYICRHKKPFVRKLVEKVGITKFDQILRYLVIDVELVKMLVEKQLREKYDFVEKMARKN